MKLLILMPMYKMMDAPCVISLVDFIQALNEEGHKVKMSFTNGFNAAKARKMLATHAVEVADKETDYILWLDTDHVYKAENLHKLIARMEEEKLGMLSGTYTLHGCPDTAAGITEDGKFRHFRQDELKNGTIDCDVVGFGFLVMKREFLVGLWEKHGENLFVLDAKDNCTEDVKFCRCALDEGHRVCFDSHIKIGHLEMAVRY